ncbi:MAG TPA: hypothetical protein VF317_01610, partial [Dermatophilaceae bacterium]
RLSHGDIVRWHSHLLETATWGMGAIGSDGYGRKRAILHQTQHAHTSPALAMGEGGTPGAVAHPVDRKTDVATWADSILLVCAYDPLL